MLTKAMEQTGRAGEVIRRLRQFISTGETDLRVENVNKVVEEAAALGLVGARQQGVRVSRRLSLDVPRVLIDRIQMQQVILNLLRNAVEAMQQCDPRELLIETDVIAEDVIIRVRDTGSGIAPEIAERLFQPFATTKSTGMGIGLSLSREIVEAHNGRISAEPNHPRGTTFAITLPTVNSVPDVGA